MAKRTRQDIDTPPLSDTATSKYRRVAPKQEMEVPSFPNPVVPAQANEVFEMRRNMASTQPYFPHTLPAATPSFPVQHAQQLQQTPPPPQGQVKFETALEFLDQVKLQFGATPAVYKQFLKIMKDFKLHEIDTPGVIRRVSELFRGHDHLILGFNRFLPEGYKITLRDIRKNEQSMPDISRTGATNPPQNQSNKDSVSTPNTTQNGATSASSQKEEVPVRSPSTRNSPSVSTASPSPSSQPKKQPELDHARNYVRKIKLRFERKPDIYKSFLRILHTFHEEHHTINDVYEQVASLFEDHPDLLAEFKQFLPDKSATVTTSPRTTSRRRQTTRKRRKAATDYSPRTTPTSDNDYNFFESAKSQLRNEPFLFNDFIKVLNLFNEDILTRVDLLLMTRDLFSEYPELYEEFRQFCDFEDIEALPEPRKESPSPAPIDTRCEIDFNSCKRYGPSYRRVPDEFIQPQCSGRTELCHEVLNDYWVSVPTGSEDGFKASLKNQYEETLFACEDERHELDMVIELNCSTIQVLIPLAKDLSEASEEDLVNFRIEDGLDVIHMRSIERIYGNKGHLVLQGLSDNPVVAIPLVLRRLQQKDQEWQAARSSWNNVWQEIHEKNYYRSLDHQSAQFKLKEKKLLNPRELLAEIKNDCFVDSTPESSNVISHPTVLSFDMNETSLFDKIEDLIDFQAQQMYNSNAEPEKLQSFIQSFIRHFFINSPNMLSKESSSTPFGLFFGNNSFYVFFRFYQMLYQRLLTAKQMAQDSFDHPPPVNNTKIMMCGKLTTKTKKVFTSAEEKYSFYIEKMLKPLVEGDMDSSKYEDLCRELFGISSYVLFTMDRLLQVLVKQILSIFLEDTSSKLFSLHSFEASRSNGFLESIYHANALNITGEERCFKFIYLLPDGKFTIQVLDSEQKPAIVELPKEKFSKSTPDSSGTPDRSEVADGKKHTVFLLRNHGKTSGSPLLQQRVITSNGLDCKICTNTYRRFYVEETEDYFYRVGQLKRARERGMGKQISRLHQWINNRLDLS